MNNSNKNKTSQEIGVGCRIEDNNYISMDKNNNINNYENDNYLSKDINEEFQNEEEEEEEEENEEEEDENDDNNNTLLQTKNFTKQVDFLFHTDNPEYLPPKKKTQKKIIKKSKSTLGSKKSKLKKSKSKNKNNKNKNKNKKNNKIINKIRPEFNLCTKIDPKPRTESIFYGPKDETRYEKQCRERAQKIADYEENFWRQKEIFKAKRQKEEEELKNRYNYIKSRTSNNFYPINQHQKEKVDNEFLKQFKNITKIDFPKADIRNYECNPQKYDAIIHSLLSEISEIKFQRKKENEQFVNQIKKLQNDLDENKLKKNKKRPQTGNKTKNSKKKVKNNGSLNNIINNYYKPYKKRAKTGNKLKNNNNNINLKKKEIENEIPVSNNNSKNTTKNNYYMNEKERILKNIEDLEQQKNNKINEIIEQRNYINEINNNNNINTNLNILQPNMNNKNNYNIYNSVNKYISKSVNVYQAPYNPNNNNNYNNNIYNNVNKKILNYQDKMQILTELNNNISKFTSGIPKLVNKVNQTLDKIYGNTENPIKKAINNHPFVVLASKSAFQMIQNNNEIIIEKMIDDLIIDCVFDLQNIESARKEKEKKEKLSMYINEAREALNNVRQNENEILNKYNF